MTQATDGRFEFKVLEGDFIKDKDLRTLELEASRRALALLKNRLGSARMLELILEDVEDTDRRWEAWAAESAGEWRVNQMQFEVKGLKVDYWLRWVRTNFDNESMHFEVHPEHYAWTRATAVEPDADPRSSIIAEPMGDFLLRAYGRVEEWDGFEAYVDPEFSRRMPLVGYTRGGVLVARSLGQYKETEDGFHFKLTAMKPSRIPAEMREGNQEHACLEYYKYFKRAYDDFNNGIVLSGPEI